MTYKNFVRNMKALLEKYPASFSWTIYMMDHFIMVAEMGMLFKPICGNATSRSALGPQR